MSSTGVGVNAGVVADARERQRRRWRRWSVALLLVAVAVAAGSYGLASGGGATAHRYGVPAPGVSTGKLRALAAGTYGYYATPDLEPGTAAISLVLFDEDYSSTGYATYAGAGLPIEGTGYGGNSDPHIIAFVGPDVAAVRVGDLGTIGATPVRGLPLGDRLIAFTLPEQPRPLPRGERRPGPALGMPMSALNSSGHVISSVSVLRADQALGLVPRHLVAPRHLAARPHPQRLTLAEARASYDRLWGLTSGVGACAVGSQLSGLRPARVLASRSIVALPRSVPGPLLSCLDDLYGYRGSKFSVAILVNAHAPGHTPAPLWSSHPVRGHPGVFKIKAPTRVIDRTGFANADAPLLARRVRGAWLVIQPQPGFARPSSFAQQLQVLASLRITRLETRPT